MSVWDFPSEPWQRLHIDYAGPFVGAMWLVWIDALSKYGGVERVKSADSFSTIRKFTEVVSLFGNPEQIVSDNYTPFTSHEFGAFCTSNGIRHIRSAPYHPSTNGEAKRFVQVFNNALRPQVGNKIDIKDEIFRFHQQYRTIHHSTTGRSSSELQYFVARKDQIVYLPISFDKIVYLLFGRKIRTTLDLLKPQVETQVLKQQSRAIQNHNRSARNREFEVGQPVFARQYLEPRIWVGGVISRRTRPLSYDVQFQISSEHASQLLTDRAHHQDLSDQQLE